jgi:hypothetical protein
MGRDDVRRALQAMDDEDVRARLASGDFADVAGFDFTEHERELVQGAAADYPEVAGFAYDAFLNFGGIKGELPGYDKWNVADKWNVGGKIFEAARYVNGDG